MRDVGMGHCGTELWGTSRACTKMHPMANGQSSRSILLDYVWIRQILCCIMICQRIITLCHYLTIRLIICSETEEYIEVQKDQ